MSKEKYDIEYGGDHCVSVEVYRPARSHGVLNIVLESDTEKVRFYDMHFDVAETLRDMLTETLEKILKVDYGQEEADDE
jgi:hypothetical protein